ncbi:MAG: hypothetical protein AAFV80_12590 [Bacteroidota bacterium]
MEFPVLLFLFGILSFNVVAQNELPNKIIWSDVESGFRGIYKANLDGSEMEQMIATSGSNSFSMNLAFQ